MQLPPRGKSHGSLTAVRRPAVCGPGGHSSRPDHSARVNPIGISASGRIGHSTAASFAAPRPITLRLAMDVEGGEPVDVGAILDSLTHCEERLRIFRAIRDWARPSEAPRCGF